MYISIDNQSLRLSLRQSLRLHIEWFILIDFFYFCSMRSLDIIRWNRQSWQRFERNILTKNNVFLKKVANYIFDSFHNINIGINRNFSMFSQKRKYIFFYFDRWIRDLRMYFHIHQISIRNTNNKNLTKRMLPNNFNLKIQRSIFYYNKISKVRIIMNDDFFISRNIRKNINDVHIIFQREINKTICKIFLHKKTNRKQKFFIFPCWSNQAIVEILKFR